MLTVSQTASLLNVSEKTIRRMIASRQLFCRRIRGAIRIPASEVSKFTDSK